MRIPFLILCLVVVYGACRTYERPENVDLQSNVWRAASKVPNENGDYEFDYDGIPFAKPFSRQRRTVGLLKTITCPINTVLKLLGFQKNVISSVIDLVQFTFGALLGQDVCPKGDSTSLIGFVTGAIINPIKTFKTTLCYGLQTTGSLMRALIGKLFQFSEQFFFKVFLPILHTTLNGLDRTGLLPPQISAAIKVFNLVYRFLQFMGKVPK